MARGHGDDVGGVPMEVEPEIKGAFQVNRARLREFFALPDSPPQQLFRAGVTKLVLLIDEENPAPLEDKDLEGIGRLLPNLEHLEIEGAHFTNTGLAHVGRLTALHTLSLINCMAGPEAPMRFASWAPCQALRVLDLSGNGMDRAGFLELAHAVPQLRSLKLCGPGPVGFEGLEDDVFVSGGEDEDVRLFPRLESLDVSQNPGLTAQALGAFASCFSLTRLSVFGTDIGGRDILNWVGNSGERLRNELVVVATRPDGAEGMLSVARIKQAIGEAQQRRPGSVSSGTSTDGGMSVDGDTRPSPGASSRRGGGGGTSRGGSARSGR